MDFSTKAYGKWILAGEHAVLRGAPALVFPLKSRFLQLDYQSQPVHALQIHLSGKYGPELELLVWGVIERACQNLKISRDLLKGTLFIQSSVPVGAGMGASATICVALTRWLGYLGYVAEVDFYEFARNLENMFHGESSGVDVAVALSGEGLRFERSGLREKFSPAWKPQWYVSYSGQRGVTSECVTKVKELIASHPTKGSDLDQQLADAVNEAQAALLGAGDDKSLQDLALAFNKARRCFEEWGLTEGELARHLQMLEAKGAYAVKPTGSGGGGFALSLWRTPPPADLESVLIPCY